MTNLDILQEKESVATFDFNGTEIRMVEKENEPWFIAKDVATAIEYANPVSAVSKILNRNIDEFSGCKGVTKLETPGGTQELITLNEFGLYSFCMLSKTDKAIEFRKFVRKLIVDWRKGKMPDKPMTIEDAIIMSMQEMKSIKKDINNLKLIVDNEVWLTDEQKSRIQINVNKRVRQLRYQGFDASYQALYVALKSAFGVPKYDKIKRKEYENAIDFIERWYPAEDKRYLY